MAACCLLCQVSALAALPMPLPKSDGPDPTALIKETLDNWRGNSSYTKVTMTVHRPSWERTMAMSSWTRGEDDSLVRFTAPAKDAGNATLKLGDDMWIFNPKLNQIIKLPASMMAQSWMGSDFSYNDLAKANDILTQYSHRIVRISQQDGHQVYDIEALPKPNAATVWGKQLVRVRDDGVLLGEQYFDQDMQPVKVMETIQVGELGGRQYPVAMTMHQAGADDSWTKVEYLQASFDVAIPGALLTKSNLRNPRHYELKGQD
ncbi:outer membrane lipoprotein-sorting protein [Gallaecimonas kandeliae]|uniref:outer membrane lipoprotein-sorting protein n=1 Tax=Gallaecimonas kandeliae TaxID=3029055 RepID=UPI0026487558|nr:outer membrane lipoprotein-sorting protein [Gallaecimonas kandeliae]WKE65248.1 outer membrane lipoprotein-sorting protein [Gallaecimonas kandeliae]